MKIHVISTGKTTFKADGEWEEPAIREAIEDGCNDVASAIVDHTDSERSDISHDEYATVTEDDGTVLWAGWLNGLDEPAPDAEVAALKARLKAAETYCVLSGWQGARMVTDEEKALHQLWSEWAHIAGSDFTGPDAHPELADAEIAKLARKRDEIRARTLAAIREQHPGLIARTEIATTETEAGQPS